MRFFILGFALLAAASAGIIPVDYLPPVEEVGAPNVEYLSPSLAGVAEQPTILADDGYRYKTVKKLRLRHRRDVNELVNDYLPPVEQSVVDIGSPIELGLVEQSGVLADDGYRYKTVRKLRLRHRRDVNELVNDYLPPVEQSVVDISSPIELGLVKQSGVLADDGYRYKTVKKLRLRHRRDVNELVNDYLPPVEQSVVDIGSPIELGLVEQSGVLADDGYRYKTVKKLRLRHRRDVNELVNDYLPPVEQSVVDIGSPIELGLVEQSGVLADDGYRYKTVRKLRLRHRRDVNELVNDYLPPVEQSVVDIGSPIELGVVEQSGVLADDGYRYKTVRKLRLRHRRDVNELVNDYLPPVEQSVVDIGSPIELGLVEQSGVLADDGYRYKTVRKLRLRHRRDVNELVNDYLPPVEQVVDTVAPVDQVVEVGPVDESAALAADGYRYKTVKKLRYRHRY